MANPRVATPEAYRLMHEGTLALADIEATGIRIDVDFLRKSIHTVGKKIKLLEEDLRTDEVWDTWRSRFGQKANLGSREQLGQIFFKILGYKATSFTPTGRPKADEPNLSAIDHPFIVKFLEKEQLVKLRSTYLEGILSEVEGEYLHPGFALNLTRFFRSSSAAPNFQNIPIRNKKLSKWIRPAFIPRPGNVLLEVDYKQLEVRISAAYHKDPTMLAYIEQDYDMHSDMAMEIFLLKRNQIEEPIRHAAKNSFVFASFYGDYYKSIAAGIWNKIQREGLQLADGTPIRKHLATKGIHELGACEDRQDAVKGTFEYHLKEIETRFWNERFPVYKKWREDWWAAYCRDGYVRNKTGFVAQGVMRRNQVFNAPVQSSAFNCELWSLIKSNKILKTKGFKSRIIGQIHDSILLDVVKKEFKTVLPMLKQIMTEDIRKAWPWILTRLDIDATASDVNWFEKEKVSL